MINIFRFFLHMKSLIESSLESLFNNPLFTTPAFIVLFSTLGTNFVIAIVNIFTQNKKEKNNVIKDIYSGCITNLSTVLTLNFVFEENLDQIEKSLIKSKKYLALLLIYGEKRQLKKIKYAVYLFTMGEYEKVIEEGNKNQITSTAKYNTILEPSFKNIHLAADIILQLILKNYLR